MIRDSISLINNNWNFFDLFSLVRFFMQTTKEKIFNSFFLMNCFMKVRSWYVDHRFDLVIIELCHSNQSFELFQLKSWVNRWWFWCERRDFQLVNVEHLITDLKKSCKYHSAVSWWQKMIQLKINCEQQMFNQWSIQNR